MASTEKVESLRRNDMKITRIGVLALAVMAATAIANVKGDSGVQDRLIGTWQLVSAGNDGPDGTLVPFREYGPNPLGYLMYDRTGHMCVSLANPKAAKWANPEKPTSAEIVQTADDFFAYCGTYTVDEKAGDIIHRPEMSSWPHYIGTDQRRHFKFDGDTLVLSGTETAPNGVNSAYRITWRRVQ
jgi:hypothetical protein